MTKSRGAFFTAGLFVASILLLQGVGEANVTPTLEGVFIVTDASGSWSGKTTTDAVAHNATVKLRAVLKVSGVGGTYYWCPTCGGGTTVSDLDGDTRTPHAWNDGWGDPVFDWWRITSKMNHGSNSNDPWHSNDGCYQNKIRNGTAGAEWTVNCWCDITPTHSYLFPGQGEELGVVFGTCPIVWCCNTHDCSKLRGKFSHTDEGDGNDIIEYEHTELSGSDQWARSESSATEPGTRRYTIKCKYDGVTKYTPGKEKSANVSNLEYEGDYDGYDAGGIKSDVMRIVRKSNNPPDESSDYIEHIDSFRLVPYVAFCAASSQTDNYQAIDSVDLVVGAAKKKSGNGPSWMGVVGLLNRTEIKQSDEPFYLDSGVIKSKDTELPVTVEIPEDIDVGDLIIVDWGSGGIYEWVAVLYADDGTTEGELDGGDTVICTLLEGVITDTLSNILDIEDRFVLRKGW